VWANISESNATLVDTSVTVSGGSVEIAGAGGQAILVSGTGENHGTFIGTSVKSDQGTGIFAAESANSRLAL